MPALPKKPGGRPAARPGSRLRSGFTLLELLGTVLIMAVLAATGLPAWSALQARTLVAAAASELEAEVHRARLHAWTTGEAVHLAWRPAGALTCQLLHTGRSGHCLCESSPAAPATGPQVRCETGSQLLRLKTWPLAGGLRLESNSASLAFDPARGTVTPTATVRIVGPQGVALAQVVNVMGRVRRCVPAGAPAWQGVAAC